MAEEQGDVRFLLLGSGPVAPGTTGGAIRWLVAPKTGDRVKLQTLYSSRYTVGG